MGSQMVMLSVVSGLCIMMELSLAECLIFGSGETVEIVYVWAQRVWESF